MKILAYISVNIILLTIYSYFFGLKSIQKFLRRGVIIVQQEDRNSSIISPGNLVILDLILRIYPSIMLL